MTQKLFQLKKALYYIFLLCRFHFYNMCLGKDKEFGYLFVVGHKSGKSHQWHWFSLKLPMIFVAFSCKKERKYSAPLFFLDSCTVLLPGALFDRICGSLFLAHVQFVLYICHFILKALFVFGHLHQPRFSNIGCPYMTEPY